MKWRKMIYLKIARMSRGSNTPVPSIISFGTKIKGHILEDIDKNKVHYLV